MTPMLSMAGIKVGDFDVAQSEQMTEPFSREQLKRLQQEKPIAPDCVIISLVDYTKFLARIESVLSPVIDAPNAFVKVHVFVHGIGGAQKASVLFHLYRWMHTHHYSAVSEYLLTSRNAQEQSCGQWFVFERIVTGVPTQLEVLGNLHLEPDHVEPYMLRQVMSTNESEHVMVIRDRANPHLWGVYDELGLTCKNVQV